jgi:hypothetical protein
MSDLFGAPSGVIAFHQDQDQQVQTQQRFAQMQHLGVVDRATEAESKLKQVAAQRALQLQQIAQGPAMTTDAAGNPVSPGAQLEDLGSRLLRGGFVTEGSNLLNKSSEILAREQTARAAAAHAKVALSGQQIKQMDSLNNMLAASHDQASFDAAKMVYLNENPGETIPPALQTYNPDVIEALKKVTKTGQEEARRIQSDTRIDATATYRATTAAERERHDKQVEANQAAMRAISERRLAAQAKAGGKPTVVGAAKTTDLLAASAMIKQDFPDLPEDLPVNKTDTVSSAAYDLANEAKALMAKNRGLSMTEAMTQAYAKMKETGSFQTVEKPQGVVKKLLGLDPEKGTKYKPGGAVIPFIAGKTKPEVNKVYDPGDGSKWKFDGKKMVSVE